MEQERPVMDDYERKNKFGSKGKILKKFQYLKKILDASQLNFFPPDLRKC